MDHHHHHRPYHHHQISDSAVSSSTWSLSDRLNHEAKNNHHPYSGGNGGSNGPNGKCKSNSSDGDNVVSSSTSPSSPSSSYFHASESRILRNALLDKNRKSKTYSLRSHRRRRKYDDVIDAVKFALEVNCPYTTQILINRTHYQQVLHGGMCEMEKRELLWLQLMTAISPTIVKVVEFSKQIPGFLMLPQDDQLILIKYGFFETWLLWTSLLRRVSPQDDFPGIYLTKLLHFVLNQPELVEGILDFWTSIHRLNLGASELALFSALLLLSPTRKGLSDVKNVRKLRTEILSILDDVLTQNSKEMGYKTENQVYSLSELLRLESCLTKLEGQHRECLDWIRGRKSCSISGDIPILWSEIFDIPKLEDIVSSTSLSTSYTAVNCQE